MKWDFGKFIAFSGLVFSIVKGLSLNMICSQLLLDTHCIRTGFK